MKLSRSDFPVHTRPRETGTVKGAHRPGWIEDKDNQTKWNRRFIDTLKRDYMNADGVICAILSDERLSQLCATRIRFYLDKGITLFLNEQRKARGVHHKKKLEIAIAGLGVAVDLRTNRGDHESVSQLVTRRDGVNAFLQSRTDINCPCDGIGKSGGGRFPSPNQSLIIQSREKV